jgi:ubiquitin carboxyl-terminal hydrolase L3
VFLESTELFADIHAAVAGSGQSAVPADLDTDLHFTCFVQAPEAAVREAEVATVGKRRLIELDGGRAGPVDRGESTDLLKVRASVAAGHFVFARVIFMHLRTWQSMLKSRLSRRRRAWN